MKLVASDSRIEFLSFGESGADQLKPPTSGGRSWQWRTPRAAQQPATGLRATVAVDAQALAFDVRKARATLATDTERLLAVIDCCGNGVDSFNEWMTAGLREWRAARPPQP